jgi:SpoVK/Ycf46/Vps4 family AAA+-type ATPase
MSPVVLWIDEIEKGFSPTGGDQDGGLSKRIFGTFLTWLQEKKEEVFVVATANDIFSLPPEFLRKGRFDEIFFVDLPDLRERATIFGIHLSHRKQEPSTFDLGQLVAQSEGFSGAEIEQAVIAGLYRSLHQKRALDTELLTGELRETVPLSISRREDIDRLRSMARERFVPVR